jgi:phosphatidylglycerophosphatase A
MPDTILVDQLDIRISLFRIYDIFKPFNIRSFEKYEKGWGVMLDDVAAGIWPI